MTEDRRTRRRFLSGVGVAATIGLAGCISSINSGQNNEAQHGNTTESPGNGHTDTHGSSLDGPSASATVAMKTNNGGSHFTPHVVWIEQGGTVTWELGSGSHTTTAYSEENDAPQRIPDSANAWDSGTLSEQGKMFKHTFETVGVYDYFCIPHEGMGMLGTVIVGDPDPEGQSGLQPPQDSLPSEAKKKIKSLNQSATEALGGSSGNSGEETTSHNESGSGDGSGSGSHH